MPPPDLAIVAAVSVILLTRRRQFCDAIVNHAHEGVRGKSLGNDCVDARGERRVKSDQRSAVEQRPEPIARNLQRSAVEQRPEPIARTHYSSR